MSTGEDILEMTRPDRSASDDWVQVQSGIAFYPLEPVLADIQLADIVASLSRQCRFRGHCTSFYSVAQHSVLVSCLVPEEDALWGLMHDAAEAYIGDICRPLKRALDSLTGGRVTTAEERLQRLIAQRFGLAWPMPASVAHADLVALATERRDLMRPSAKSWPGLQGITAAASRIEPLPPAAAETLFYARWRDLNGEARLRAAEGTLATGSAA